MNLTPSEVKIVLRLAKDFSRAYNAHSLAKELGISPRGALKMLQKLTGIGLVQGTRLGKAVFYKVTLHDIYTARVVESLLIAQARSNAQRWIAEFEDLFAHTKMLLIFGSILRNPKEARDIDLLCVFDKPQYRTIAKMVEEKNRILPKKIHLIPQTIHDFEKNIKENPAIREAVKEGYVLHGYDVLVEALADVTSL